jgi:hypothetical protein
LNINRFEFEHIFETKHFFTSLNILKSTEKRIRRKKRNPERIGLAHPGMPSGVDWKRNAKSVV